MKHLIVVLMVLLISSISAFAQMSNNQGAGMMGGSGWWGGMGYGPSFGWIFVIVILVILGVAYLIKRK